MCDNYNVQSWETQNWYRQTKYESQLSEHDLAAAICQSEWPPTRESLQVYGRVSFVEAQKKCDKFWLSLDSFSIAPECWNTTKNKLVTPDMKSNLTRKNVNCGSKDFGGNLESYIVDSF